MELRLKKICLGLACICFILLMGSSLYAQDGASWTSWGYDLKNTRFTPSEGPQKNEIAWKYEIGRCNLITSPLLVEEDTGYFTDDTGKIYAVDLKNPKRTKWVYQLEGNYFNRSLPIISEGRIYLRHDNIIFSLEKDGNLKNAYKLPSIVTGFTVYAGVIYAVTDKITAIDAQTGAMKWEFPILETTAFNYPAIDNDTLYARDSSYLYAIDIYKGVSKWYHKFSTEDAPKIEQGQPGGEMDLAAPAIAPDGIIYVNHADKIWAIHPDGTVKWGFIAGSQIYSSPAIMEDNIIFGDMSGMIYSLNRNDSSVNWCYQTQDAIFCPPIISKNGDCYLRSSDSNIYAFTREGNLKWIYGETYYYANLSELTLANGQLYITAYNKILVFGEMAKPPEPPEDGDDNDDSDVPDDPEQPDDNGGEVSEYPRVIYHFNMP